MNEARGCKNNNIAVAICTAVQWDSTLILLTPENRPYCRSLVNVTEVSSSPQIWQISFFGPLLPKLRDYGSNQYKIKLVSSKNRNKRGIVGRIGYGGRAELCLFVTWPSEVWTPYYPGSGAIRSVFKKNENTGEIRRRSSPCPRA